MNGGGALKQIGIGLLTFVAIFVGAGIAYAIFVSGGDGTFLLGSLVVVIALLRLLLKHEGPTAGRPSRDDPRFLEHTSVPQLAGMKCGFCATKITGEFDGRFCKDCGVPIHKDCRKEHRAAAHTKRQGAYR